MTEKVITLRWQISSFSEFTLKKGELKKCVQKNINNTALTIAVNEDFKSSTFMKKLSALKQALLLFYSSIAGTVRLQFTSMYLHLLLGRNWLNFSFILLCAGC